MKRGGPLQRKTPMRRSLGFGRDLADGQERRAAAARLALQSKPQQPARAVMTANTAFNPQPKHEYIRSPGLMALYRTLACQHCHRTGDAAGVCGAHSNWAPHNKGLGIKADDNRCAALCWACHKMIDQGSRLSELERKEVWWPAHVRTICLLTRTGRWPKDVPVPDVEHCPWELAVA